MTAKTTDSEIRARIGLRRHFLRQHHAGQPLRVLDVAHAPGDFWPVLRQEFTCDTYWQILAKPKKGFPKIDPAGVLSQEGWKENVIDLHMQRSPWTAWSALLPRIHQPTTVFLTVGRYRDADALVMQVLGCEDLHPPLGLVKKMQPLAVPYFLYLAVKSSLTVADAGELESPTSTRSIAVHLLPSGSPVAIQDTVATSESRAHQERSPAAHE